MNYLYHTLQKDFALLVISHFKSLDTNLNFCSNSFFNSSSILITSKPPETNPLSFRVTTLALQGTAHIPNENGIFPVCTFLGFSRYSLLQIFDICSFFLIKKHLIFFLKFYAQIYQVSLRECNNIHLLIEVLKIFLKGISEHVFNVCVHFFADVSDENLREF